ncbi:diacylglycerol kinase [Bifidobacterium simiarum]|uniref:Diacylglycerol kinase n=2 Tax=Bifidobacterium simiarum TaxID=2045441 RepID=A0A2M9HF90_9BIFI|nr:diacylglycerol kinase family protein [Bifidobacterium simiarum]PJM75480.1 diacylglycerol kinase [Bifidobacterium simiarum]
MVIMSIGWIVVLVVLGVLAVAAAIAFAIHIGRRRRLAQALEQRDEAPLQYAFIVNPSKPEAGTTVMQIRAFFRDHDLGDPMFIETQLDKDGKACAREAIARGADAVVAVGGDGTVRTVASVMAGSDRPFGIIPIGTGNLFARNMGIPIADVDAALTVATSHGSRKVDMGRMRLLDSDEPDRRHAFLIIAGIGFDAAMIDDTDPALKKNISWLAYFVGGVKNLFTPRYQGDITISGENGVEQTSKNVSFRTFMAGNCGQIPGFSLMPEADYGDGILDFELIDTTGGLIGWANLFGDVLHQTITRRAEQNPLSTNSSVDQIQGSRAEIRLVKPALAQVDGDILGNTSHIEFTVDHQALCIRVPEPTTATTVTSTETGESASGPAPMTAPTTTPTAAPAATVSDDGKAPAESDEHADRGNASDAEPELVRQA